ncbi:mechanosensitive ion channel family protein [Sinomonas sp. R1AF57]|uniref:mechanosensitive ion channel family protein n=1 Tax=Sinomonas sp. R1AF57 TaxID=2020377 RepID=UPI000B5F56B6|nr:mechanosensitive ion channel family protein [Sinomonas sp. R1AF57]ASN52145.1 mechanosensitive ion channel protein MscS [Sinomonas sp. R1AF57]
MHPIPRRLLPVSEDIDTAVAAFNEKLIEVGLAVGAGLIVWLVATFVIRQIVKRILAGPQLAEHRLFRWAAPALRALDSERRAQRAATIGSLLNSTVAAIISTIVGMYVLRALGVDLAPLLTSVGILGVAIGFGAQQLIRDFLAGIFITLEDQFGIGDVIETGAGEVVGTVESVGLRITRVRADDGTIWYLRNGEILRVGNRSQGTYVPVAANGHSTDDNGEKGERTGSTAQDSNGGQRSGE